MWWRRRPTHSPGVSFGAAPDRGALQRAPLPAVAGIVVVAVAPGVFFPLLGISLVAFLVLDLNLGAAKKRRSTARDEPVT